MKATPPSLSAGLRIALFSAFAFGGPVAGWAAPGAPKIPLPVEGARIPDAVPAPPTEALARSDWRDIRSAHEIWRHRFREEEGGRFSARNTGQRWETVFDGRGFLVRPDHGAWEWGLELRGYGIGENRIAVERKAKGLAESAAANDGEARLVYRRDAVLEEWFCNDARGLEQGWTLAERPVGASGTDGEKLHLDLAVRGGLRPEVAVSGRAVRFVDGTGAAALTYGGLKAWDAGGHVLEARFVPGGADGAPAALRIEVDERGAVYPVTIDPVAQQAYLKASNTDASDGFGGAVAVDGDTVVVGAASEFSASTGVNGDESDNSANAAGAAYVFVRNGSGWSQQAYLKASNTDSVDRFGTSVAVDGGTLVVGATDEDSAATGVDGNEGDNSASASGAAYVFVWDGMAWIQQAYLKASSTDAFDLFGESVAVSGDTVVVGAYLEDSNAVGVDGDDNDNSTADSGAAYVFVRNGTTWSHQAYLKASNTEQDDRFGISVAVDGNTAVIGAYQEDSAATGVDGNEGDNSFFNAGAVYVFARSGLVWSQQAYLKASNTGLLDQFGRSVAVDGDTAVVGADREDSAATGVGGDEGDSSASESGAGYVFVRSGGIWSQEAYLKASNTGAGDGFGSSVAMSGDTVVVGAFGEDSAATGVDGDGSDDSASLSGAAYVFARSGAVWSQEAYLKASNTGAEDRFGVAVAVDGATLVVGATDEDSAATGVDGDGSNNGDLSAGAGYVFDLAAVAPPPAASPDTIRPRIRFLKKSRLKKPRPRHRIVGTATDNAAVAKVEVRSRLRRGWRKAKLRTSGRWIFRTPRLASGRNKFKVRAWDASGNRSKVKRVRAIGR